MRDDDAEMKCKKDCNNCKKLNYRTDSNGYPYAYECLKYGDSVFRKNFTSEKDFFQEPEINE